MNMTHCFAIDNIVTSISINNAKVFDIEIMMAENGGIYVPTKMLAKIFETPVKLNHAEHEILIKNGKVTTDGVYVNNKKISSSKVYYLKTGTMEQVKDELFVEPNALGELLGVKIKVNKSELTLSVETKKELSYLTKKGGAETGSKEAGEGEESEEEKIGAYTESILPRKRGKITVNNVNVSDSAVNSTLRQIYEKENYSSTIFNNNTSVNVRGDAYGGKWNMDLCTSNYEGNLLSFGGIGLNYQRKFGKYDIQFGKVTGTSVGTYRVGSNILGIQVSDFDQNTPNWSDYQGTVDKNSLVNVYIDEEYNKAISTYGGYFDLKNLKLDEELEFTTIRLKEVLTDGKEVEHALIRNQDPREYTEKKQNTAVIGVTGYNDRLFSNDGYIYQNRTKKFVLGTTQSYRKNEKTRMSSGIFMDRILGDVQDSVWGKSFYDSNAIMSMGIYRNPATLQGLTYLKAMDYKINNNMSVQTNFALSYVQDIKEALDISPFGYSASSTLKCRVNDYNLGAEIFNHSSDFYLAGSEFGFLSDRLGGRVSVGKAFQNFGYNVSYSKYLTNLKQEYAGGFVNFDEGALLINGKIPKIVNYRISANGRNGQNSIGSNMNYYYDINFSRMFLENINLEGGFNESNYEAKSNISNSGQDFFSKYSMIYTRSSFALPKNRGRFGLGHEFVTTESDGYQNNYNRFIFNYTFPEIKRMLIGLGMGYKYTGETGMDYTVSLGYRLKSGSIVALSYQYSKNNGYFVDNMYIPTNAQHSFNLVFNENFAPSTSGLRPVGNASTDSGFVEVVAYLDKNGNGKYDEEDVGVPNVPFKANWAGEPLYTIGNGKCKMLAIENGVYKVDLDEESLPTHLSAQKTSQQILVVRPNKITQVEFPIKSSVGNIKGKLNVSDDFGRGFDISDFIVVLNNLSGEEIDYSTVDKQGNYYFSGIPPGEYVIKMDEGFKTKYGLESTEGKSEKKIEVPFVYKDVVDLKDLDLHYKSWY